jgi:UPF0716 protein FxsA
MNPLLALLLILVLAPLTEIYVLIRVGSLIGALPTIGLCVATALAGSVLIRIQGLAKLARIRASLEAGELPAVDVLEGAVILISGVLLLTPGFVTDLFGFLCLVPPLRRRVVEAFLSRHAVRVQRPPRPPRGPGSGGRVIEGEYERRDEPPAP